LPYSDTLATLGDHIRKRRLDLGLRQRGVATQLGVNVNTLPNWEKHHSSPQLYLIPRVIAFLGYDLVEEDFDSMSLGERVVRVR
jgi:transcriptional regulator with XRE-family HTH domain